MSSKLQFKFKATFCNGWPQLNFYLDNTLCYNYAFNSEDATVALPIDFFEGDHLLEIELYGKTEKNTKVLNGKILQDQIVTLEAILIDDVEMYDLFLYRGRFEQNNDPQLTWGVNGKWRWTFSCPIITWAIHTKYNARQTNDSRLTSSYFEDKKQILLNILDEMEQDLDEINI